MTIPDWLDRHADSRPDGRFCTVLRGNGETVLTWSELRRQARAWAALLEESGVAQGDIVLLFLPTGADLPAAFLGAMLVGAIPSIMPPPTPKQAPEIYWRAHAALFERLRPAALVSDAAVAARMAVSAPGLQCRLLTPAALVAGAEPRARRVVDQDDIALLQHSSGTTGLKKGVALSHRAVRAQVDAYAARLDIGPAAVVASWLPLYHDMGLATALLMPLALGIEVVQLDPFEWAAGPDLLWQAVERFGATHCWLPNFAFEHLARRAETMPSLASLKAVVNCSEPCRPHSMQRLADRFAAAGLARDTLRCSYAMAESVFAVSHTPGPPVELEVDAVALREHGRVEPVADGMPGLRLASSGVPLEGVQVSVRDADGRDLPPGRVGEIVLRAPFLFDGYFRDPATTAQRLRDGAYLTRDRGFVWNGEIFVLGRLDDMLIVNGRNMHAHELEALAGAVPGTLPGRIAAFAVDNDDSGSADVVVVAEAAAGTDAATIRRAIRQTIYDTLGIMIQRCEVVAPGWIVKTTSGKVSRDANRTKFLCHLPNSRSPA